MGSACSCAESNIQKNAKEILKFRKEISVKLNAYSFDNTNKDEFVNKICKENNIQKTMAESWVNLYTEYMVCVGFNYNKSPSRTVKEQMTENLERMLAIPYELLQVWRVHVLYTKKYEDFCNIVTNNGNKCIPFKPPKVVWKTADPTTINNFFKLNHSIMTAAFTKRKGELDSLFVFQSSYLKNTLHFCLCETVGNSNIVQNIITAYNNEANNENGVFKMQARDINSMKTLSANIENMIFKSVVPYEPVQNSEWKITSNVYGNAIQKSVAFQNFTFPQDFELQFGIDHLLSLSKAHMYIHEYRKFLFCAFVGNTSLCPSEQVDLVWHYHQSFTSSYRDFSKMYMNCEVYGHNPSDGSESDSAKYTNVYNLALEYIMSSFGDINQECWPTAELRFNQVYRWYNHHLFMGQTRLFKEGKTYTTTKVVNRNIYLGCYMG